MQLLRSEGHLRRWRAERDLDEGATLSLDQQWRLSAAWYGDRMHPSWRRRTIEEAHAVFADCGLTGAFWSLV